jgi:hypothetical protein
MKDRGAAPFSDGRDSWLRRHQVITARTAVITSCMPMSRSQTWRLWSHSDVDPLLLTAGQ